MKASVFVSTAAPVVIVKLRRPSVAPAAIVAATVAVVPLVTVVELTVMPEPLKDATLTPLDQLVPLPTTAIDGELFCAPVFGVRLVIVPAGGGDAVTVNPFVAVSTAAFVVIIRLRLPTAAPAPMVMLSVAAVALVTVVELTVMFAPLNEATVTPLDHAVPVPVTATARATSP